jgi:hypothetical protein
MQARKITLEIHQSIHPYLSEDYRLLLSPLHDVFRICFIERKAYLLLRHTSVRKSAPIEHFYRFLCRAEKAISRRTAGARMYQEPFEKTTTRKAVREFSQTQFNYTQALLRLRRGNWIAWIMQTELSERFWMGHTKTWRTTRLRTKLVSVRRSKRLSQGSRDRPVFDVRPPNASLRPKQPAK